MRRFFYKSLPVFLFFCVLTVATVLSFSLIIQANTQEKAWQEFSPHAVEVTVRQIDTGKNLYSNRNFLALLQNCKVPVTVSQTVGGTRETLLYSTQPKRIESFGSNADLFSTLDAPPEAIGLDSILQQSIKRDGEWYYIVHNLEFKVIETYPDRTFASKAYIPMAYILAQHPNQTFNGSFYLDAEERTQDVYHLLQEDVLKISPVAEVSIRESDISYSKSENAQTDVEFSSLILIAVLLLVLLNLYHVVRHWLLNRKKEIRIRILTGAPRFRLCVYLSSMFGGISLISMAAGCAAAAGILAFPFFPIQISMESATWALAGSMLLIMAGIAGGSMVLILMLRKMTGMGWED